MHLDRAARLSCEILQPTSCGIECLTNRYGRVWVHAVDVGVFVMRCVLDILQPSVRRPFVAHHYRRTTEHGPLGADLEMAPVMPMPMRELNEQVAPDHA